MPSARTPPGEHFIGSGRARLHVRDIGHGTPIVVVHGGPGFDHEYLLPDMDRLSESFRLVYFDQRGRGRSFSGQTPEDVTMRGELEDLDRVRRWLAVDSVALLGHSWGGFLALNYAASHPDRVSRLILMNTAPASHRGRVATEREIARRRTSHQTSRLRAVAARARFQAGDIDADAEFYRLYFASAVRDGEKLERMIERLRAGFTEAGIVVARGIAERLEHETWDDSDYDLVPRLGRVRVPTLIIHGDDDFIPLEVVQEIERAVAGAQLVVLPECGHFAYVDQPERVRASVEQFLDGDAC